MLIEFQVASVNTDPFTNMPFVLLKDMQGKRGFPIWIGIFEAGAIASELEKIKLKRPMTHDLFCNTLVLLKAHIDQVEIVALRDNTYFAQIRLAAKGTKHTIDARPSDAIALALRSKCPIFVEEEVIRKARRIDLPKADAKAPADEKEKWKEILEQMNPEDFGKYKQ